MDNKKALLLVGSPKPKSSISESLGGYLLEKLQSKGYDINITTVSQILKSDVEEFFSELDNIDIVIVAFPLYIDGLPTPLIRVLELIEKNRREKQLVKKQSLLAISNGGYPEAFHNDTAIKICRLFAERNGFKWLGGLAIGQGALLHGRPLSRKGTTSKVAKALDIVADAIEAGEDIPAEAVKLMKKGMLPAFAYLAYCRVGWNYLAKPHNTQKLLHVKAYKAE